MTQASLGQCGFNRGELDNEEASWELDVLNRKEKAHRLERLIANTAGPYVIAMTSEWGSGKTFFLKAWEKDLRLRQNPRPCVYFNAWESDHAGDPLLALTGSITQTLRDKGYIDKAAPTRLEALGSAIAKNSPRLLLKCLVGWGDRITDGALTEIKDDLINSLELGTKVFLENQTYRKGFIAQLKDITELVAEKTTVGPVDEVSETKKFPLLIMIDELDRCKPSYAIELLESVKHLFNVPGIVFFISIDPYQLLNVIEHTFGLKDQKESPIGSKKDKRFEYLKKFIDLFWTLPEPNEEDFLYSQLLQKKPAIPDDWPRLTPQHFQQIPPSSHAEFTPDKTFYKTIASVAQQNKLKLREYAQLVDKFKIISEVYKLTTRESIAIFDMLVHKIYDFENQNMTSVIRQANFTQDNEGNIPLDNNISVWELCYRVSINNSYRHDNPLISYNSHDRMGLIKAIFIPPLVTDFSGEQLTKSVQEKIALLEEFNFGDDANNG